MTLRATVEIVPFGNEEDKRKIGHLNISNIGEVDNLGFGHSICNYRVELYRPDIVLGGDGLDHLVYTDFVERHDRRDGALALVAKASKLMEEHF